MKTSILRSGWVLFAVTALILTGCSAQAQAAKLEAATPAPTQAPTQATYADPFAYCAAVGTIAAPDAAYTGQAVPEAVINGFKKAAGLEASTEPMEMFQKTTVWRCMDNQVYACNVGANLPCSDKADTNKTPTQEMNEFCQANPDSDFIPMSVTGHSTIYSWRCNQNTPEVLEQIEQVDGQGYLARIWYPIEAGVPASQPPATPTDPAPTAPLGAAIQPLIMEVCDGQAQAMAHALDVLEVTQSEVPLNDIVTNKSGAGCQATVTGTGVQFKSPDAVLKALAGMLVEEGWAEDMMLQAGGPTGIGAGYRKGDQICLADAIWHADESANCPKDQPITACVVKPEQQLYTINLTCGVEKQ